MTTTRIDVAVTVEPAFVDKAGAAQMLGNISERKLNELIADGRINPQTIDARVVFTPDEVRRFAAACPAWEPAK